MINEHCTGSVLCNSSKVGEFACVCTAPVAICQHYFAVGRRNCDAKLAAIMTTAELETNTPTFREDRHLIAGRYRTESRIGKGRLGEIFAATDETYQELGVVQHLAIQVIPESIVRNNKLYNKISQGFTVLRSAAHPNIVNVLNFGRDGKFAWLAMELLDGVSLRTVLDGAETLPPDEARPVIRSVGEALRLLHARDMVHGNLTARNVFVTQDFEVRLLDIVPLASADAIIRSTATSDPFSRCTVEDDVYGLACLSYEMLSGKHPFNHTPPAAARTAGLEADRIAALNDAEWNALRRALSFERAERPTSIAEFMGDFGIAGTERLRRTADELPRHEYIEYPAVEETLPAARRDVAPQNVANVTAVEATPRYVGRPPAAPPVKASARPLRAILLGILLAALVGWSFYGEPEEHIVSLIGYVEQNLNLVQDRQSDDIVTAPVANPGEPMATEPVTPPAQLAAPTTSEAAPAEVTETDTAQETTQETTQEITTAANDESISTVPEVFSVEPFVSVSEGDGAARIVLQGANASAAPLIWWTSAHTAAADDDFIAMGQQVVSGDSAEAAKVLHVPLVNDNLPEPTESFFVNFGRPGTEQGQIERIATVRVDVIDDD